MSRTEEAWARLKEPDRRIVSALETYLRSGPYVPVSPRDQVILAAWQRAGLVTRRGRRSHHWSLRRAYEVAFGARGPDLRRIARELARFWAIQVRLAGRHIGLPYCFGHVSPRSQVIWLARVGLLGPVPTLRALAKDWAISYQRTAQVERAALRSFSAPGCPECRAIARAIVATARLLRRGAR